MVFLDKNSNKKVYQVLNEILGLGNYNTKLLCKKFGFQQKPISEVARSKASHN